MPVAGPAGRIRRPNPFATDSLGFVVGGMLTLMAFCHPALAQPAPADPPRRLPKGFVKKSIELSAAGPAYKYAVFLPPQYGLDKTHRWPLLVYLHGSGECGNDGIKQTTTGLPFYISRHTARFPFITVMPQASRLWFRGEQAILVWEIIRATQREYRVDPDRVYLTGFSMGGYAAWELAIAQPDAFAGIVPVCGAGPKELVANISHLPVWAFHGAQDTNVPVSGSRAPIAALRKLGARPRYTEYPDQPHDCWDKAYSTPELWSWLLRQRRKPPPRVIDYRLPSGAARVWWLFVQAEADLPAPARIRAELGESGEVKVESEGVASWGLVSDSDPLLPGTDLQVTWNGAVVFRDTFKGQVGFRPRAAGAEPPEP
jgi:predicted esterase